MQKLLHDVHAPSLNRPVWAVEESLLLLRIEITPPLCPQKQKSADLPMHPAVELAYVPGTYQLVPLATCLFWRRASLATSLTLVISLRLPTGPACHLSRPVCLRSQRPPLASCSLIYCTNVPAGQHSTDLARLSIAVSSSHYPK